MKERYRLFLRRKSVYYAFDTTTKTFESLKTKDKSEANRLLMALNDAGRQPAMNLGLARVYLKHSDPQVASRTWQQVIEEIIKLKQSENQQRWIRAGLDPAFDIIRNLPVMTTRSENFLRVLEVGTVSTNVFLRRLHNFAVDMNWLPWPLIPKKQWPVVRYKVKRAITAEEHERIVGREPNVETKAFYELCWHLGGSQTDIASLNAEDIDWGHQAISYRRRKTNQVALLNFGDQVAEVLRSLPLAGPLFPRLAPMHEKHRAKEFHRRCAGLGIKGVTLHSYRYAWAERAKTAGYPERFAMAALGHNSQAIHRAYAKNAHMILPSLESFEKNGYPKTLPVHPLAAVTSQPVALLEMAAQ
jgi:integrase